jgi:hypothetical protein
MSCNLTSYLSQAISIVSKTDPFVNHIKPIKKRNILLSLARSRGPPRLRKIKGLQSHRRLEEGKEALTMFMYGAISHMYILKPLHGKPALFQVDEPKAMCK